jgi:hypothetical protein
VPIAECILLERLRGCFPLEKRCAAETRAGFASPKTSHMGADNPGEISRKGTLIGDAV